MPATIYAHGNVDALHGTFNAIAMVMGGTDYADMVRVAVIIGFMTVGVAMLAPNGAHRGMNWFISVAVLNGILFIPRTEVIIVDRLNIQPTEVVGGVPWSLAVLGSVKSSIGVTITQAFDTGFQTIPSATLALPSELSYMDTGVVFGSRLVKLAREAGIANPKGNADVLNYMRSCVFPDLQYDNMADRMQKSTDLQTAIANPNPAMITAVHVGADINTAELVTMSCPDAYAVISPRLNTWADEGIRSMAAKSFPQRAIGDAITQTESSLISYVGRARLMDASATARDVMIQNILINATADAAALQSASLNDPATITLSAARAQAVSQMNASYITQGRIGEEALPLLRNVVEAIIYALFPIACLLMIASEGQGLKNYVKYYILTVLWVELWAPMFAIINFLRTIASAANLGAAGTMTGAQGLSLETASAVFGTAVSDLSVASWMVTFVPLIAGAALFGMNQLVSAFGGGRPGAAQSESSTSQTTKGNHTLGALSFGQMAVSDTQSDPFVRTMSGIGGSRSSNMLTGQAVDQYAQSSNLIEFSDTAGYQRQTSEARTDALKKAHTQSQAWSESVDASFSQLQTLVRSGSKAVDRGTVNAVEATASGEAMRADSARHAGTIASRFGITDQSAVDKGIAAVASGSLGAKAVVAQLGAGLKTEAKSVEGERLEDALTKAAEDVRDRHVARKEAVSDNFRHSEGFTQLKRQDRSAADSIDSSLRTAKGFREGAAKSLDHAQSLELAERKIQSFGQQGTARWANEISSFMRANGENPLSGVGSTARQRELLRQFIMQGDLAGPNGSWMPDLGQGPNVPQDRLTFNENELRSGYAGLQASEHRQAVRDTKTANDAEVTRGRSAAGVSPTQAVGGEHLQQQVTQGQSVARQSIGSEDAALRTSRGEAADKLNERGKDVSGWHSEGPLSGFKSDNKTALKAKSQTDIFPEERLEVEAQKPKPMTPAERDAALAQISGAAQQPPAPAPMGDEQRQRAINSIPK